MTGAELDESLALDVQVYNECREMFGDDGWSGHRSANDLGSGRPDVAAPRGHGLDQRDAHGVISRTTVFLCVVVPAI